MKIEVMGTLLYYDVSLMKESTYLKIKLISKPAKALKHEGVLAM